MAWKFLNAAGEVIGLNPSRNWNFYDATTGEVLHTPLDDGDGGGDHVHGLARWASANLQTTFELPDLAEYLEFIVDDGVVVDPAVISLSADRTQVIFDTAPVAASVIQAGYVVARL